MIDRKEIVRYLGAKDENGISQYIDVALKIADDISPQHVTAELDIASTTDGLTLSNGTVLSGELATNSLKDCNKVLILVATLTLQADHLLNSAHSTIEQAVLNATFSAKIEDYIDGVEKKLATSYFKQHLFFTPRFSPGYGDLPLSLQPELLAATNAEKLLGIHLSDNLMLLPVKTVTAIIGISNKPHSTTNHKCDRCTKQCIYKKL